jgi:energy-coupling factor transporter transmembrane protein EcfT
MSLIFFIIAIVVLILAFLFLAKLLVENVPKKFFPYISLLLLLISVFLGYKIVDSVVGDIKFNKEKAVRYQKAIDGLKLIRDAEVAYKNVKGDYTSDYAKLIEFIETGSNPILQTIEKTINVVDRGVAERGRI